MALPTKEEIVRRKKVMRDAGIPTPNIDETWGPWWENRWQKVITHPIEDKYYGEPSVFNFLHKVWDKAVGNKTFKAEPIPRGGAIQATDMSTKAQIGRTLRRWKYEGDPVRDIVLFAMPSPDKPVKLGKAVGTIAKGVGDNAVKFFTGQVTKGAVKKGAKKTIKFVPKAAASYVAGQAVDKASKTITGKSWADNASEKMSDMVGFQIEPVFGEMTNPGYGYGYWVANNYSNLGRYTLDNLRPWGYAFDKEQLAGLGKTAIQPFYKTPPTFFTHRPKWYTSRKRTKGSNGFLEARFENGANWARIPESEVPRVHFTRNSNGTVSPTYINNRATVGKDDFKRPGQSIVEMDDITPGMVGGDHSNYTYLGDDLVGNSLFQYSDRQKLNPQWRISDWVKNKFNLQEGSQVYNLVHRLGGIDLSPALGYKPFTIEFMYGKGFDPNPIQTTDAILIKNANQTFTNPKP